MRQQPCKLTLVEDRADDHRPTILQGTDKGLQALRRTAVRTGDDDGPTGTTGDRLMVGGARSRWSIDDHRLVVPAERADQRPELRPAQQLLWIGRHRSCRQNRESVEARDAADALGRIGSTGQNARQAKFVGNPKELVLAWAAQIGIDQQRALAELGEDDRQVGGDEAAALAGVRAEHRQCPATAIDVEPAKQQLAAQGAQLLDDQTERVERGDFLIQKS